jgi:hypothetical protein
MRAVRKEAGYGPRQNLDSTATADNEASNLKGPAREWLYNIKRLAQALRRHPDSVHVERQAQQIISIVDSQLEK